MEGKDFQGKGTNQASHFKLLILKYLLDIQAEMVGGEQRGQIVPKMEDNNEKMLFKSREVDEIS